MRIIEVKVKVKVKVEVKNKIKRVHIFQPQPQPQPSYLKEPRQEITCLTFQCNATVQGVSNT